GAGHLAAGIVGVLLPLYVTRVNDAVKDTMRFLAGDDTSRCRVWIWIRRRLLLVVPMLGMAMGLAAVLRSEPPWENAFPLRTERRAEAPSTDEFYRIRAFPHARIP